MLHLEVRSHCFYYLQPALHKVRRAFLLLMGWAESSLLLVSQIHQPGQRITVLRSLATPTLTRTPNKYANLNTLP